MNRQRQRGFTLIELIIFIVVVSAGLAGILLVMNTVVTSSADPMVRKQAVALADSILEEILQKEYADPDGVQGGETTRATKDDVDDYNAIDEIIDVAGPIFLNMPTGLDGYRVQVAVAVTTLGAVTAKSVTVTVSRGAESVTMTGYRSNY